MVGGDVEQHRDLADEAVGQVELEARQFEDIDAAVRQRLLRQDRRTDVAAEARRDAGGDEDMVDQRGGGRLAVGPGDGDDLVRRQPGACLREQLDVTDDRDARADGANEQRRVVRHAGGNDHRVELAQVGGMEVG